MSFLLSYTRYIREHEQPPRHFSDGKHRKLIMVLARIRFMATSRNTVKEGDIIATGLKIGTVGCSGNAAVLKDATLPPHLHFALIQAGQTGLADKDKPLRKMRDSADYWQSLGADLTGAVNPGLFMGGADCWTGSTTTGAIQILVEICTIDGRQPRSGPERPVRHPKAELESRTQYPFSVEYEVESAMAVTVIRIVDNQSSFAVWLHNFENPSDTSNNKGWFDPGQSRALWIWIPWARSAEEFFGDGKHPPHYLRIAYVDASGVGPELRVFAIWQSGEWDRVRLSTDEQWHDPGREIAGVSTVGDEVVLVLKDTGPSLQTAPPR